MFRSKVSHEEAMRPKNFRRLFGVLRGSLMTLGKLVTVILHKLVVLTVAISLASDAVAQETPQTSLSARFSDKETRRLEDAEFAQLRHVFFLDPAPVVAWNQTVNEIAFAEDQF